MFSKFDRRFWCFFFSNITISSNLSISIESRVSTTTHQVRSFKMSSDKSNRMSLRPRRDDKGVFKVGDVVEVRMSMSHVCVDYESWTCLIYEGISIYAKSLKETHSHCPRPSDTLNNRCPIEMVLSLEHFCVKSTRIDGLSDTKIITYMSNKLVKSPLDGC